MHGVLVVFKPSGPTSTRVIETIKRKLGQKKIGHAGTLDPLAEGVLVVLLGQATKVASYILSGEKGYRGRLELGLETDTYDILGEVTRRASLEGLSPEAVREAVMAWSGRSVQEVPPYSAAKHQGQPLYSLARKGLEVPVKLKEVEISQVEILKLDPPEVEFRVRVSSGAYIRSLVHSLGKRLGCGAVLTALTRELSHPFEEGQAIGFEELLQEPEKLSGRVLPLAQALPDWAKVTLTPEDAAKVKQGKRLVASGLGPETAERALFLDPDGEPAALVEKKLKDGAVRWVIIRGF